MSGVRIPPPLQHNGVKMYSILLILASIIAVFLVVIVLLQSSKGGGLAGTFGGGAQMGAMFGTRRTADFLSRATWWLGGTVAVLAIVINLFFLPGQSTVEQRESIIQQGQRQSIPQNPSLPQQPAPQQQIPPPQQPTGPAPVEAQYRPAQGPPAQQQPAGRSPRS